MKIKLKIKAFGFEPETTLEVSESVGLDYIESGDAVEVKEAPKRKSVSNKALTAKGS